MLGNRLGPECHGLYGRLQLGQLVQPVQPLLCDPPTAATHIWRQRLSVTSKIQSTGGGDACKFSSAHTHTEGNMGQQDALLLL